MLWQERRKYAGVLMEQMLIFVILMVSMVALFEAINKYQEPGLLNTDNTIFGYMLPVVVMVVRMACGMWDGE